MRFALAALALATLSAAHAAGKTGALTVDIRIDGQQRWQEKGGDHGQLKVAESFHVVLPISSVGGPTNFNPLAADYYEKQAKQGAQIQSNVAATQERFGGPAVKRPKTQQEYMAMQQALAAEMQKGQAACKGNVSCLMELSQGFAQKSAAILPPGSPEAQDEDARDTPEAPPRFQAYAGDRSRTNEVLVTIDDHGEGAWNDVGGMVPWKESNTGRSTGTGLERKSSLYLTQLQHDFVDNEFFVGAVPLPSPRGKREYWDRLHGEEVSEESELKGIDEALSWAQAQFRDGLPMSGTRSTVLKPARARGGVVTSGATFSGEFKVRMDWKLELR